MINTDQDEDMKMYISPPYDMSDIKGTVSDKKNLQILLKIKTKYLSIKTCTIFLTKYHILTE